MSVGSISTPTLRFTGGMGRGAARAKNWSIMLFPLAPCPKVGSSMPAEWSTQWVHPSAQSLCSFKTWIGPRCSTQPGQAHRSPQVHPDPAIELKALNGGIVGKSGTIIEDEGGDDARVWIWTGGRSERTKGATAVLASLVQHDFKDTEDFSERWVVEHDTISPRISAAALASMAKPFGDDSVADAGKPLRGIDRQRPRHCRTSSQWQGLSNESTVCFVFAGCEEDEADKASDIPFGSVGTVGMKRFGFLSGRAAGIGILSTTSLGLQVHFEWTRFEFRNSRHVLHCDTGRPFFFTSNNGRSE